MTAGRIFLRDRLASADDIDAVLSAAADDPHGTTSEYVARVSPEFFAQLSQPNFSGDGPGWASVAKRLKSSALVLLPSLPTTSEARRNPGLLDLVELPPLRFSYPSSSTFEWRGLNSDEVASICSEELQQIVEESLKRCVLEVSSGHFELPSGAHTSHFIRFAECLSDLTTVDDLAYWIARDIAPRLRRLNSEETAAVLVDNPSILILALRLSQIFPGTEISCHCLPSYPQTGDAIAETSQWLQRRIPTTCKLLIGIVSVSSTAGLQQQISAACSRISVETHFSVLYGTTKGPWASPPYCTLQIHEYEHYAADTGCQMCAGTTRNTVYKIDPARYFLHERRIKLVPLPPSRCFTAQKSFLEKYGRHPGVLAVHVNDPNDANPRHHGFYVSVSALLQVKEFTAELVEKIEAIDLRPDLVVIPNHGVGHEIGHLLGSIGLDVEYHDTLRLKVSEPDDSRIARKLSAAKSLLILDDLAFSGARMQGYNKAIREADGAFQAPTTINFFPLLVLASDTQAWKKVVKGIELNHPDKNQAVLTLYAFQLPDGTKNSCPWCAEARELEKLPTFDSPDADQRSGLLLEPSGLKGDEWVYHSNNAKVPGFGASSPILREGSTAIELLISCASAVQQARTAEKTSERLDPDGFPLATALDIAVMKDFQNETLIVAALLRSVSGKELSDQLKDFLRDAAIAIASGQRAHDVWALREFVLAERRGVISRIKDAAARKLVYGKAGLMGLLDS